MKNLFSAAEQQILKITKFPNVLTGCETARDYVVLITFVSEFDTTFTMPASVSFCRRYCKRFRAGELVSPISSSEVVFFLN